ncbi:MAG TPA: hypothetical protein VFX65_10215 [Candidatus Limnocylindrales bacterium]|nr:hypothetical protein [Candidatus Limnocylindrales bacterium]
MSKTAADLGICAGASGAAIEDEHAGEVAGRHRRPAAATPSGTVRSGP